MLVRREEVSTVRLSIKETSLKPIVSRAPLASPEEGANAAGKAGGRGVGRLEKERSPKTKRTTVIEEAGP